MAPTFDNLLDVLNSKAPPPVTNFVSYVGSLDMLQIQSLSKTLRTSSFAGGLRLKRCKLDDSGAELIAEGLEDNKTVQTVELPDNEIECRGAELLAKVLKTSNFSVTSLDLTGNPCEMYAPEAMEAIEVSLHRNRASLSNSPQNADTATMANSSPSMSLTLRSATSPDSRDVGATCATSEGGFARRVLQTNGKENWALSIGEDGRGQAWGPGGVGGTELEYRLQNLESSQTAIASELDRVKTLGSSIEGWKLQVNNANNQAATALDLVKCNGADMRSAVQAIITSFQEQLVSGGQHVTDKLAKVRQEWAGLGEEVATLRASMVQGATELREGAEAHALDAVEQLRNDCGEAVDDVWERVETLEAKAGGLDDDVQDVQQHTQKLDAHINDMLKKMLGTLDRGQEHLKWDVQQLTASVQKLQEKLQQDRPLDDLKGTRQPALPYTPDQAPQTVQVLDDMAKTVTSLEFEVRAANKFAENEAVRRQQGEATTESLLAHIQLQADALAQHQAKADEQANTLAAQAEAHATLQHQMQHQSEAIASLQTQLASVTQQADAPANPNKQQPALAYDDSKVDTCASHTAEDDAMLHDDTACAEQQAVPSNAGRKSGRESKGGKQGGVAWRTRWFTVRWSGGPHRFL